MFVAALYIAVMVLVLIVSSASCCAVDNAFSSPPCSFISLVVAELEFPASNLTPSWLLLNVVDEETSVVSTTLPVVGAGGKVVDTTEGGTSCCRAVESCGIMTRGVDYRFSLISK